MLINEKSPHGGDIYTNRVRLDFSANLNPAGTPPAVVDALKKAAETCAAYPDPYCTALRDGIASVERVPAQTILCGNGAAELIYAFAYALPKEKPALIVSPTFCEYETALTAAGIKADHYVLKQSDGFRVTEDFFQTDFAPYCAVFLCSPNNPTGITVKGDIIRRLAETGTRVLLDLTFLDLTETPDQYDIPRLIAEYPNLTVLRAFTKSYAMAGVRLGYVLCGDEAFLQRMSEKTQCWNVSSLAQAAGAAALGCGEWLAASVKTISSERERLMSELQRLGIFVFPGEANYLLLYSEKDLYGDMLERGILLRDCSNYVGLGKGFVRIAVRSHAENDALLAALREALR